MQQIRFIISDLDGTLLSESHHLTPQVCEAVQKYKLNGGWFTFATGRPYITVKPIAEKLGIEIPFICCNGFRRCGKAKNFERKPSSNERFRRFNYPSG